MMAMARPSKYSQKLAGHILERHSCGETLTQICRDEGMPSRRTVTRWTHSKDNLFDGEPFRLALARARDDFCDFMADEIFDIADDGRNDWMTKERVDGSEFDVVNHEYIQRSKLRVDARKWALAKMQPHRYGEKVTIGGDPEGAPIKTENISDQDLARRIISCFADDASGSEGETQENSVGGDSA